MMWIIYSIVGLIAFLLVVYSALVILMRISAKTELKRVQQSQIDNADPLLSDIAPDDMALVYFWSEACAPCKLYQKPAIDALLNDMPNVKVITVNAHEQPDIAQRWQVMSLPRTFVIGKNRQVHTTNIGVADVDILKTQFVSAQSSDSTTLHVNSPELDLFKLPKISFTRLPDKP